MSDEADRILERAALGPPSVRGRALARWRRGLWGHRDFLRLWLAETVSVVGNEISAVTLPLVAVTVLGAGSGATAMLTAVGLLPFLVLGLPAGVWVDRMRRRPILVACDLARAAALATVPIAWWLGELTLVHLYATVLVMGVGRVLFDVAHTSYLPRVVSRRHLLEGNSKLYMSQAGGQVAGPALTAGLLKLIGPPAVLVADVASFFVSAVLLARIGVVEPVVQRPPGPRPSLPAEVARGHRWVMTHPLLRPTTLCATIYNFGQGGLLAIYAFYGVRVIGLSPSAVAGTLAAGAAGFVAGTLVAPRVFARVGIGRAVIYAALLGTAGQLLMPLARGPGSAPLLAAAWLITWFGPSIYGIAYVSLRQSVTPDELQGRQNASTRFMVWGAMSLGSVVVGVLAEAAGGRTAVAVMAIVAAFCNVPLLASKELRQLRTLPGEDPPASA